jgi:excisionase family DNA binding protein
MEKVFYSVEEVAALLELHPVTVREYAREGRVPAAKLGRRWRFPKPTFDAWVAAGMPGPEERKGANP